MTGDRIEVFGCIGPGDEIGVERLAVVGADAFDVHVAGCGEIVRVIVLRVACSAEMRTKGLPWR